MLSPIAKRKYQREWLAKRRQEWFDANGSCVDCGSFENLELDHVDPNLKISHKVWSWSKDRRDIELSKCVIRCYKCHKERTRFQLKISCVKIYCPAGHLYDKVYKVGKQAGYHWCSTCNRERKRLQRLFRGSQAVRHLPVKQTIGSSTLPL